MFNKVCSGGATKCKAPDVGQKLLSMGSCQLDVAAFRCRRDAGAVVPVTAKLVFEESSGG